MPMCNCGRGSKAIYICFHPSCPGYSEPLYCAKCDYDKDSKHSHKGTPIKVKVDDIGSDWSKMVFEKGEPLYEAFSKTLNLRLPVI